jgi:hypothetical protein
MGFASISEIPLVYLHEKQMTSEQMLEKAKRTFLEAFQREKNETNIMFWSLFIECDTHLEANKRFVKDLIDYVRSLDDTRFLVMASLRHLEDLAYNYFDVIGVNYWEGWYRSQSLQTGAEWFKTMASRYTNRPLLVTSHGWEGLYGHRNADTSVYWSEDLQARYLAKAADLYMDSMNIVGEIVWTFADFYVSNWLDAAHPHLYRMRYLERPGEMNNKGLVDHFRRPKIAYFTMREKFLEWKDLVDPVDVRVPDCFTVSICERNARRKAAFTLIDTLQEAITRAGRATILWDRHREVRELIPILTQNSALLDWSKVTVSFIGNASMSTEEELRSLLAQSLPGVSFEVEEPIAADAALCFLRVRGAPLPEDALGAARTLILALGAKYGPMLKELFPSTTSKPTWKPLEAAHQRGILRFSIDRKAASGLLEEFLE